MINAGTNKQALIAMGKKLHGSSLIEVLIALLVLSFGMMGMAGVQSASLRGKPGSLLPYPGHQFIHGYC